MGFFGWAFMPLRRWRDFSGRSRRREFFSFGIAYAVVMLLLEGIANMDGMAQPNGASYLSLALRVLLFIPSLALSVRRLHDSGRSGWWLWLTPLLVFLALLPSVQQSGGSGLFVIAMIVVLAVLVFFMFRNSQPGTNRYGPNPKVGVAGPKMYNRYANRGDQSRSSPPQQQRQPSTSPQPSPRYASYSPSPPLPTTPPPLPTEPPPLPTGNGDDRA